LTTASRQIALVGALTALVTLPAWAEEQVYQYRIEHPTYGAIGTYTNTVEQAGDNTVVASKLHVVVSISGMVVFREDARRTERWQSGRFMSFQGVTVTNGNRIEIRGDASAEGFIISSPSGVRVAPSNVHPANPWSVNIFNTNVMMSTKSGELFDVGVVGNVARSGVLDGMVENLRQYEIHGEQRQFVWVNDSGITTAFRILEKGTPIDFVLVR
jgi:hypothetical protein